jgi:hypothetical protein
MKWLRYQTVISLKTWLGITSQRNNGGGTQNPGHTGVGIRAHIYRKFIGVNIKVECLSDLKLDYLRLEEKALIYSTQEVESISDGFQLLLSTILHVNMWKV